MLASRPHRAVSAATVALLVTDHADKVRANSVRRDLVEPVAGEHRVEHTMQVISPNSTAITSASPAVPGPMKANPTSQPARSVPGDGMTLSRPNRATSRRDSRACLALIKIN